MRKCFIIRSDGSSIFEQAYNEDFIFHCLFKLLDSSDEQFQLLWFTNSDKLAAVQADSAYVAVERISELKSEYT